jgi:formylglycine-generating enzyme required for sulfatase activity
MKKLMITVALLAATAQALAMPTRAELSNAQPLVNELMAPDLEGFRSATDKTVAAVNVGDRACAFAAEVETEAAKFLLLKGAVSFYVRGEAYDKAADCIATMQSDIGNLSPDVVAEIVGKAASSVPESKAPRLFACYRAAKLQIRARKELPGVEQKLNRGKSIMVKIKNGIELEFVPCPAGTFTMGTDKITSPITCWINSANPNDYAYKHKVTITRPFWMSKYPITVEQFGAFCPIDDEFVDKNGKQGEPKVPVCLRVAAAEDYCKWLNRRFASALPPKCIFRLPTDAEWEYALFANGTDKDDPYVRLRDGEKAALQEICGPRFPVPVGTAGKPNAWGLYDMLGNGCHFVLDTISYEYVNHGALYGHMDPKKKRFEWNYSDSETDPLRWYVPDVPAVKGKSARHLMRGGCYVLWAKVQGPNVYFRMPECGDINCDSDNPDRPRIWTFRVVIGPDLVSEWMAKNGKK